MTAWQRRLRWLFGMFAIVFAVAVVFAFKRSAPAAPAAGDIERADPNAVVESTSGTINRFKSSREDVSVQYEKQLTYADGSTRMIGVKVVTTDREGGRTFTVTGNEGQIAQGQSTIQLDGNVQLDASDGFSARTEHASYTDAEGMVSAPGPVEFTRGRLRGSGVGMTYDKNQDALTILDKAVVHFEPDGNRQGGLDVTSGSATFARRDHQVRFERTMHLERGGRVIDADTGVAFLSADEKQLDAIELHGAASISGGDPTAGGLRALTGDSMNLKYLPDGQTLQRAVITGTAALELAGQPAAPGRRITAEALDITLAPDGTTPVALLGQKNVVLTLPGGKGTASRTIRADSLDARGDDANGLTSAHFAGAVDYRETGQGAGRAAKSRTLDAALKPGTGEIDDARFAGAVRFEEAAMQATAASARYSVSKGTLELSGSEPAMRTPRVVNEQIRVDASRIDLTLAGPKMSAKGGVQSELQPPSKKAKADEAKLPSLLKQDQVVNVTADALEYDGAGSKAVYTGGAQLWQGDTSIKASSITLDDATGDLLAAGPVTTTTMLDQQDKNRKTERIRSIGTAAQFTYEEKSRRATYVGGAHLSGPQGDMTAEKIELYLKPSGDALERAEAYDSAGAMTLREQSRTTTGSRMTYTAADDRYVVTGTPVKITDECGRETTGRTLTFHRATDSIVVDGNGFRTQTKGGTECR